MKNKFLPAALIASCLFFSGVQKAVAQKPEQVFKDTGKLHNPTVDVNWNRYYNYAGLTEICAKLARAYPDLVKLETIGESTEGRRIWVLTVTDFTSGDPDQKPALYLSGNTLAYDVQGSEFALYTAWYLAESFQDNTFVEELLQQKTFYILPSINPDARDHFMQNLKNASSSKVEMTPRDVDGDGLLNEDLPDDLNKDGHITHMRRKSASGRYIIDPQNPLRLILAKPGQPGDYDFLGFEGLDRDRDGNVNTASRGNYDPNRDWAWNWQPDYIHRGAYKYPFSLPETRAVKNFVLLHPNIAGAQNYHDMGGMTMIGREAEENHTSFTQEDNQVYHLLGKYAEQVIPGYSYKVRSKEEYSTAGGELDWFYGARGIFTFSNELIAPYLQGNQGTTDGKNQIRERKDAAQTPPLQDAFVEWRLFEHPTLGLIEIGGLKKNFPRAYPGSLLEEEAHRNMVYTLYHAFQLPYLEVQDVVTKLLVSGQTEVTATVANTRLLPTHSAQDVKHKIMRPNYVTLLDSTVVASMVLDAKGQKQGKEQKVAPARIEFSNLPGKSSVKVRWIVNSSSPNLTIEVDSRRGGVSRKAF